MSLLLLKTKDLTWQDHTLNIEVMLAPTRSQLLLNKHKTLATKSQKMKDLYEKQRATCIKDYVLEKRLMERYRQRLGLRMQEIAEIARAQSAKERKVTHAAEMSEDRQLSAPVTRPRHTTEVVSSGWKPKPVYVPQEEQKPVKFFITESGTLASMLPRLAAATGPKDRRHPQHRKERGDDVIPDFPSRSRTVTFTTPMAGRPRPAPPQDPHPKSAPAHPRYNDSNGDASPPEQERQPLDNKVAAFLEDMKKFNEEPPTPTSTPVDILVELGLRKQPSPPPPPLVARRYTNLTMETESIKEAFDEFCRTKDQEELSKAMKLSSKLRSRSRLARNQSIVPSIATFKATRSFKALVSPEGSRGSSGLEKIPEN